MDRSIYMGGAGSGCVYVIYAETEEETVQLNPADEKELAALREYIDAQYA